jgi:hypothetical protein
MLRPKGATRANLGLFSQPICVLYYVTIFEDSGLGIQVKSENLIKI